MLVELGGPKPDPDEEKKEQTKEDDVEDGWGGDPRDDDVDSGD